MILTQRERIARISTIKTTMQDTRSFKERE